MASRDFWHHEWLTVFTVGKSVGLRGEFADELFLFRIEAEPRAKDGRSRTQINAVCAQVLAAAFEGV